MYMVKDVKTFQSVHNTGGWNASLYRGDGEKKVCLIVNDGSNKFHYKWVSVKENAIFLQYVKQTPYRETIWARIYSDGDILIAEMVDKFLVEFWQSERKKRVVPEKRLSKIKERLKKEMSQSSEDDREREESLFGTW